MPETGIEDVVLLHQLVTEPERGIRALQQRYGGLIYRIVCRVLPEYPQDAEEVAADVLVKTWENAAFLLEDNRPLTPWLIVTARNRAIDRRRKIAKPTAELSELIDILPEKLASDGEELIGALVAQMEQPDREIFLRRYYRMETAREIGEALGINEHTVNVRLSRGRARLKKEYLKQMGRGSRDYAKQHGI